MIFSNSVYSALEEDCYEQHHMRRLKIRILALVLLMGQIITCLEIQVPWQQKGHSIRLLQM